MPVMRKRGAQAEGAAEHALGGAPLLAGLHKVQVGCQHQHDPPVQIGTAAHRRRPRRTPSAAWRWRWQGVRRNSGKQRYGLMAP
jgi:hypothetical protein